MYKRHSIWEEDKWDIHNSGNSGSRYSGSSNGTGASYAGNGKNPSEHYQKSEMYSSNSSLPEKIKDFYRANENHDDSKKVEDEKKEDSLSIPSPNSSDKLPLQSETKEDSSSKKETKSIEDAIEDAIKEKKQIYEK